MRKRVATEGRCKKVKLFCREQDFRSSALELGRQIVMLFVSVSNLVVYLLSLSLPPHSFPRISVPSLSRKTS